MLNANTIQSLEQAIGPTGFGQPRVFIVDANDQTHLYVLSGSTSEQAFTWILDHLNKNGGKEVMWATDCITAPGQGTTLPEAVVILHCRPPGKFRVGVIEYDSQDSNQQRVRTLPITWKNAWWTASMQEMGRIIAGQLTE